MLTQIAVYCGIPIGVDCFRVARQVLNEGKAFLIVGATMRLCRFDDNRLGLVRDQDVLDVTAVIDELRVAVRAADAPAGGRQEPAVEMSAWESYWLC